MSHSPLSDLAARQAIDSLSVFSEYRRAHAAAREYAGGMYWKQEGVYEYLVKTRAGHPQERLGRRNPENEAVYLSFHKRKTDLETRQVSLKEALVQAERLNKAVKAGQSPSTLVALLNALETSSLVNRLTVLGTHALYVYALAAGIRIEDGRSEGLLWDARVRVRFQVEGLQLKELLPILQNADPSFKQARGKGDIACNSKGFQVELLREGSSELEAPFEHPVIDVNGRMAMMRTLLPRSFVSWAKGAERDVRERGQADFVESLLRERLLSWVGIR